MESQQDRLARKIEQAKVRAAKEKLAARPQHDSRLTDRAFRKENNAGPGGLVIPVKPPVKVDELTPADQDMYDTWPMC